MHEANFIDQTSQAERRPPDEADAPRLCRPRSFWLSFTWAASCLLVALAIMGWLLFQVTGGAMTWANAFTWANACLGLLAAFLLWMGLGVLALLMEGTVACC